MFQDPYISQVTVFAGNYAPVQWMFCQGQLLSISAYTPLYSLIGNTYGGDGVNTFALPDFRGRVAIHAGQAPGMQPYAVGDALNAETVVLTANQLPAHNHAFINLTATNPHCSSQPGTTDKPKNLFPAQVNGAAAAYSNAPGTETLGPSIITPPCMPVGGTTPINIVSPYLAMNYIICYEGIFPSRN